MEEKEVHHKSEENQNLNLEKRKEQLKTWLSNKNNLLLTFIGAFIALIYIYYFFKLGNQPIWFDEGDYLAIAKVWALDMVKPEWWSHFTLMRPPLLPLTWALLFKLNFSEIFVRFFTLLIPALLASFFTYKLSTALFNKKVAVVATIIFSFNWVWVFYSLRLLTDIPSTLFLILSAYCFWQFYEKENKDYGLYLAVFFGILSMLARFTGALVLISIALYMLVTQKFDLFKKKSTYIAALVGLATMSFYFIYNLINFGNIFPALSFYQGSGSTSIHRAFAWEALTMHIPNLLGNILLLILFIIGVVVLMEFILYADLVFTQKNKSKNNLLFVFLLILVPLCYFIFGIRALDTRYLLVILPFVGAVIGLGIMFILDKLLPLIKNKNIWIGIFIILILSFSVIELKSSDTFIKAKYGSYQEIKDAGLWLKDNTAKDAKIITASITQNQYYSERSSYDYYGNNTFLGGCFNMEGVMSTNESCQKATEQTFNEKLKGINPDYLVLSVFEPVFTPQWAYDYPLRHNMTFVKAFGNYNNQPALIIYKFNK